MLDFFGEELLSWLIDWAKTKISYLTKRQAIIRHITETTMRAPAIHSCVNLKEKFKNPHLVKELLAHRSLLDISKGEAIRTFLGEGYDEPAYEFVSQFWDSMNTILAVGEESLADRKAVEGIEAANNKLDNLAKALLSNPTNCEIWKKKLADYCNELAQCYSETAIPRKMTMEESGDLLLQSALLKCERSLLIYADPGMGKSRLLKQIASELAMDLITGKNNSIPVLLEARKWSRQYSNLEEAVAKELLGSTTEESVSLIKENPAPYCLIVDGLDEARCDRDLLLAELARFANNDKGRLICSSRFSSDRKRIGIESASLQSLSENEVISYLRERGIRSPLDVMRRLNEAGRELMGNPLHLNCLIEYLHTKGDGATPRNLAAIYSTCITSLIEAKLDPDCDLDADYLQRELGNYALECLINQEALPCRSYLLQQCAPTEAELIEQMGKYSGLLVIADGAVGFSHTVLQEYLAASFLNSLPDEEVRVFCKNHSRDPLLKNFFVILCGCTASATKQKLILDQLENNNLSLYMDCLRGRMNLSDELEGKLSKTDITTIALQAITTYTNITNRYLKKAKPHIPFWRTLSTPEAPIRMEISYSATTTVAHIVLSEKRPGDDRILVKLSDDKHGPVIKGPDGSTTPIFSIRLSNRPEAHTYRIGALYEGIDCAREMALSMIVDDLEGFFESAEPVLSEPLGMKAAFTEEALRCSRILREGSTGSREYLNLRNCSADELSMLLAEKSNYNIKVCETSIPLSLLPYLVKMLEIDPENHLQYLPPNPDNLTKGRCRVWESYTDKTFESWCKTILPECEKSYRLFIRTFMEEIGEYLPGYADGPFSLQATIIPANENSMLPDRRICISPFPIEDEDQIELIFVENCFYNDSGFVGIEERIQNYIQTARLLGRPGNGYEESILLGSTLLTDKAYIHNEVRKRIQKEVYALFTLH